MNPSSDISFNPPTSLPHLVLLFVILAIGLGWLAWKSSARASRSAQVLVVVCRILLVGALLLLLLNPGRWIENREETKQYWSVLVDESLSMGTQDPGEDQTRWDAAQAHLDTILDLTEERDDVEVLTFAEKLNPEEANNLSSRKPEGNNTDLASSSDTLLTMARGRSDQFRGAIVLTDGRQTREGSDLERVALRARSMESPFYFLPLGGEVKPVDLSVEPERRQFVAFAGQEASISAKVRSQGLGPTRPEITLTDASGKEWGKQQVELSAEGETEARFRFPAPEPGVHLLQLSTPEWPGERILANNEATVTVTVLDGTTKIFMAEGAPYWDSKFLAQMIRNQENMEIASVYRLAEERFFRVETGDERPSQETENIFPSTPEALAEYDLIVLGKGVEYFLDEKRLALLSEFVRDRGGSILFTRGKPYRANFEGIEFLEPVTWGEKIGEPLQLRPTRAGEAAGLFGDLLPGVDDPVWDTLPQLEDSHQCLEIKPFTEILLEGRWTLDGREQALPLLMSRRFGRGMTLTLNADGLWQWDFFPSEKGVEGQYEEFWSQLIQWAITFSEFLPGQDLSLHLDQSIVRPGELVRARIGYRGDSNAESPPQPGLALYRGTELLREIPASKPGAAAVRWEASITLNEPGSYRVAAIDQNDREKPGPSLPLTVLPPPSETEQLSADPDFLAAFAEVSGGRIISADEFPDIVSKLSTPKASVDREKAEWEPIWDQWYWFSIVLFIGGLEWFTRRRSGLL